MAKKSDALKIAEIQSHDKVIDGIFRIVQNPLVISVGLYLLIERMKADKGFWTEIKTDVVEVALFATPVLVAGFQSGAIGEIAKLGSTAVETATKALPLLAAA